MQRAVSGFSHQYARLAGLIETLRLEERRLQAAIVEANESISKKKEAIAQARKFIKLSTSTLAQNEKIIQATAAQMDTLAKGAITAFGADISSTVPRKTWPKKHLASWGAVTREILRQLAAANGVPLTTDDLAVALNTKLQLNLDDAGITDFKRRVGYRLKTLCRRGVVNRVSSPSGSMRYSTWAIAASAE